MCKYVCTYWLHQNQKPPVKRGVRWSNTQYGVVLLNLDVESLTRLPLYIYIYIYMYIYTTNPEISRLSLKTCQRHREQKKCLCVEKKEKREKRKSSLLPRFFCNVICRRGPQFRGTGSACCFSTRKGNDKRMRITCRGYLHWLADWLADLTSPNLLIIASSSPFC